MIQFYIFDAGWSNQVMTTAFEAEDIGSNPVPAVLEF